MDLGVFFYTIKTKKIKGDFSFSFFPFSFPYRHIQTKVSKKKRERGERERERKPCTQPAQQQAASSSSKQQQASGTTSQQSTQHSESPFSICHPSHKATKKTSPSSHPAARLKRNIDLGDYLARGKRERETREKGESK
jgi:hypothetical protein